MAEKLWRTKFKGGNRHPSLETAQQASLHTIAAAIARAVREGLEGGRFVVVDGIVRGEDASTIAAGACHEMPTALR